MRACVTGGTGFIGEHLVRALAQSGHEVRVMARSAAKVARLPAGVEVITGDLVDAEAFGRLVTGMDVVFHLAAAIRGPWEHHRRLTVEATAALVDAAAAAGVKRFVYVSSLAVYDRSGVGPRDVITEESPLWTDPEAAGPYGRGKIEAERCVRERSGMMEYVIGRPGLVYGPGHVIFEHLGMRVGKRTFLSIGGGSVSLPLVHVESVADALMRLAVAADAAGGTFNIVDDEQASKREYVRTLSRHNCGRYRCIGIPAAPITAAAEAAGRLRERGLARWLPSVSAAKIRARTTEPSYDCSKLRTMTGWRQAHDLSAGLAAAMKPRRQRAPVTIRRVGIIGAGRMAPFHIQALRQVPGVEVCGVLDVDQHAAAIIAQRFGIPVGTSDREEFYQRARPESVHILTPPGSHAEPALDAMSRGAHVFLEKPMALTLGECAQLGAGASEHGVTVGVNHNFKYHPCVRRAREMIESGAIGELVHVDLFWAFDIRRFQHLLASRNGTPAWAMQLPGGPLEDLAPHPFSIALELATEDVRPVSIRTFRSGRLDHRFDDELRLLLAGRRLTISLAMTLSAAPDDMVVSVYGTGGTLRLDVQSMLLVAGMPGRAPKAVARGLRVIRGSLSSLMQTARNVTGLALRRLDAPGSPSAMIREHYRALESGSPLPVAVDEGRRIVELTRAVWPALSVSRAHDGTPSLLTPCANVSPDGPRTGRTNETPQPS
jgi:nucleoside-diphosphate-sugar epimerase/predicted dehydrogenase